MTDPGGARSGLDPEVVVLLFVKLKQRTYVLDVMSPRARSGGSVARSKRSGRAPQALQPIDVVLATLLAVNRDPDWRYHSLAEQLQVSSETIHASVKRLGRARMFNELRRRIIRSDFLEFLEHGVRFIFPGEPSGVRVRGIGTAFAAAPLAGRLLAGEDMAVVWPSSSGDSFGFALEPLHRSVPALARQSAAVHELLALVDGMRIGGARDREVAREELQRRLS